MIRFQVATLGRMTSCEVPPDVADRLVPLIPDAERVETAGRADVRVAVTDEGWRVEGPTQPPRALAALGEVVTAAEWYLAEARLATQPDRLQLHASACVTDDGAIVAVGSSGRGKSALATVWSLAGLPLLGDDALILAPEGVLHGLRRTLKLTTPTASRLGLALAATLAWEPGAEEVWVDPAAAGGWAEPARARRVATVRWQAGAATVLRPVPRAHVLREVLVTRMRSGASGAEAFDQAAALVEGAETYDLVFGDARAAAAELVDA